MAHAMLARHAHQAQQQKAANPLHIGDGWNYFVHGWSSVIADVFALPPPDEITHKKLAELASAART